MERARAIRHNTGTNEQLSQTARDGSIRGHDAKPSPSGDGASKLAIPAFATDGPVGPSSTGHSALPSL